MAASRSSPGRRQPAMGPRAWGCPRCWASSVLGFISLLSVCSAVVKTPGAHGPRVKDSGDHTYLEGIRGGTVLFQVTKKPGAAPEGELEKLSWSFGPESDYTEMFEVLRDDQSPRWFGLQEKLKQRVRVLNMTSLRIENLTLEDSGQYRAQAKLTGGKGFVQIFHLRVYEPVPHPLIRAGSPSLTPDWCNVTLECDVTVESRTSGTTDLNVTWKSRELEQGGTLGPALNSWTLAVSLPWSQLNASFICVVSNWLDQKTATKDLRDICAQGSHGWDMARLRSGILAAIAVLMLILGAGLYLWMIHGKKRKKMEPGRGAGLQEEHKAKDGDVHYADLMEQKSQGISELCVQEKSPLTSIYSEVRNPGKTVKMS